MPIATKGQVRFNMYELRSRYNTDFPRRFLQQMPLPSTLLHRIIILYVTTLCTINVNGLAVMYLHGKKRERSVVA